jgi:hypothetical protein
MGSRQAKFFANEMDKKRAFFAVAAYRPAVHRQFHFRHDFLLAPPPGTNASFDFFAWGSTATLESFIKFISLFKRRFAPVLLSAATKCYRKIAGSNVDNTFLRHSFPVSVKKDARIRDGHRPSGDQPRRKL